MHPGSIQTCPLASGGTPTPSVTPAPVTPAPAPSTGGGGEGGGGGGSGKRFKRLSKGEIKKLQDNEIDPHDLKPKYNGSRYDLFKNENGDIAVLPKNGVGEPDFTGYNINDF